MLQRLAPIFATVFIAAAGFCGEAGLGSPQFLPTPERPTGWRGDGSGNYSSATPPLSWGRWVKGPMSNAISQAAKPVGDQPAANAKRLWPVAPNLTSWLIAGPFPANDPDSKKWLAEETVPNEAQLQGEEGGKVGASAWKAGALLDKDQATTDFWGGNNKIAYAHTYIRCEEPGEVHITFQHNHGLKVWFNGAVIYDQPAKWVYNYATSSNHGAKVTLNRGWNRILCKISRATESGWFGARVIAVKPQYESKNVKWVVPLPSDSYAMPIVVGSKLFFTSNPCDLVCMNKDTGEILWMRSTLAYYAAVEDAKEPPPADAEPIDLAAKAADVARLEQMNEAYVKSKASVKNDERTKLAASLQTWIGNTKRYRIQNHAWGGGNTVATPSSDGTHVYVWHGESSLLACYDLDGNRKWVRYCSSTGAGNGSHHGINGSSIIIGDRITVLGWGCMIAFDKKTGKMLWKERYDGTAFSSHVVSTIGNADVMFSPTGRLTHAADGKTISKDLGYDGECASPAFDPRTGMVGIIARKGILVGKLGDSGGSPQLQIKSELKPDNKEELYCVGSPLIADGIFYGVSQKALLRVVDMSSGQMLYTERLPLFPRAYYGPNGAGMAASICKGGKHLFLLDNAGSMAVIEPGPAYKLVGVNTIVSTVNEEQEVMQSTPVFDGNSIFIRGAQNMFCISEAK